jgi:hypothetical protein
MRRDVNRGGGTWQPWGNLHTSHAGAGVFQIQCGINQSFEVQASMDLVAWSTVSTVTNLTGTLVFEDAEADQHESRYYRVVTTP